MSYVDIPDRNSHLKCLLRALNMTEHEMEFERRRVEADPRAWLAERLRAMGWEKK